MDCFLCYRSLSGLIPDVEYDIILQSPVCTICVERAKAEHGPGWQARARAGCYAGGRIDPHLLNLHPAQKPITLGDILTTYDEVMGGRPVARPITEFGGLPPFGSFGQVVYNRYVPEGMAFLYGGRKAGQSAIIYRDTFAHWEHRFRLAMAARWKEIDGALDWVSTEMHAELDALAEKIEARIKDTDPLYITVDFPSGTQVRSLADWQQSEWGLS